MAKKIFQNPISEDNKKSLFGCAFEMQPEACAGAMSPANYYL